MKTSYFFIILKLNPIYLDSFEVNPRFNSSFLFEINYFKFIFIIRLTSYLEKKVQSHSTVVASSETFEKCCPPRYAYNEEKGVPYGKFRKILSKD